GIIMRDPFGERHEVYLALYAYVADQPEACKVAGTFASHQAQYPCHRCLVRREDISNMEISSEYRTEAGQAEKVEELLAIPTLTARNDAAKAMSIHPVKAAIWGLALGGMDVGNPYRALLIEIMHALDLGTFMHIISCIRAMLKKRKETHVLRELDLVLQTIARDTRISGFRLPGGEKGGYFAGAAKFQAFEHRAIMQVCTIVLAGRVDQKIVDAVAAFVDLYMLASRRWYHTDNTLQELDQAIKRLIPMLKDVFGEFQASEFNIGKVHGLVHLVDDIRRSGVPVHYNANMFEFFHQPLVKRAYRASNKRDAMPQIVKHSVMARMLQALDDSDHNKEDSHHRMVALQKVDDAR
ncbi:unnamed protein product, partial [Closterium sp. Naga37s-1]